LINQGGGISDIYLKIAEMMAAAILSVALHSLAYDFGDKYDDMDLSQHE